MKSKQIDIFYCRLETFCFLNMKKSGFSNKERYLPIINNPDFNNQSRYDVYAEQYNNIDSVINRIIEIEKIWTIRHKSQLTNYWDTNIVNLTSSDRPEITCISAILYNRWRHQLDIGMYCNKWVIPSYSEYTNECKDNIARTATRKPGIINIYFPEITELFDYKFISKEKSIALIKEFLDTDRISRDFVEELDCPYEVNF